VKEAGAKVGIS